MYNTGMDTDTINRRSKRFRQPDRVAVREGVTVPVKASVVRLTPPYIQVLWFLHVCGELPSSYLWEFMQGVRDEAGNQLIKNKTGFTKRLNQLFHAGYLSWDRAQRDTEYAHCNYHIYGIADRGLEVLQHNGLWSKYVSKIGGPYKHKIMVHCIVASLYLASRDSTARFLFPHEILERSGAPLRAETVITHPTKQVAERHDLVLDNIVGFEYTIDGQKKYLALAIEADRGTEVTKTSDMRRKSFYRSFLQYRAFIETGAYKEHFNLNCGMCVLNVLTKPGRVQNVIDMLEQESKESRAPYMLFQTATEFGVPFKPTNPVSSLFTEEWHRAGCVPYSLNK